MANNKNADSIHILRASDAVTKSSTVIPSAGQPFWNKDKNILAIGDGSKTLSNIPYLNVAEGAALGEHGKVSDLFSGAKVKHAVTADNYSNNSESAPIATAISELNTSITNEKDRAQAAEAALSENLDTERADREGQYNTLNAKIEVNKSNLEGEKVERTAQDVALQEAIATETGARKDAVKSLIGEGMAGAGTPPLQGYDRSKGTIEERLTDLGFKSLPTARSIRFIFSLANTTIAYLDVYKGSDSAANTSSYVQGKFAHLYCQLQIPNQYTLIPPSSIHTPTGPERFYWNVNNDPDDLDIAAAGTTTLPPEFCPRTGYAAVRPVYVRRVMTASGQDSLSSQVIDAEVTTADTDPGAIPHSLQLYIDSDGRPHLANPSGAHLTGTVGSNMMSATDTIRKSSTDAGYFEMCYPVN